MKRILIIGATSAIASACARRWAAQEAAFFLVGRDSEKLAQTASDLIARGAKAASIHCMNATDFAAHTAMISACRQALPEIDIALIAHGTLPDQKACEADAGVAVEALTVNSTATIAVATEVANLLALQRHGTLAVISSVAGDRGRPSNYVYGAAKAAVSAFCEGLRARLFKVGVHVTTIKPGFVDTPMTKGLSLPRALVASPDQAARRIVAGIDRKVAILYVPAFWAPIMMIMRNIPQPIFKRLNL